MDYEFDSWESYDSYEDSVEIKNKSTDYLTETEDLIQYITNELQILSDLLDISIDDSFRLLVKKDFKINYESDDIYQWDSNYDQIITHSDTCQIPYCEPDTKIVQLDCGHSFCEDCLTGYLGSKIDDGLLCLESKCMNTSCKQTIGISIFLQYLPKDKLLIFLKIIFNRISSVNSKIFWHDCGTLILNSEKNVCKCGDKICFRCKSQDHYPCPCDLYKNWKSIEKSTDATEIWLQACTKECPKCKSRIQKNAGCQHMTCKKCNFHFCWICLQDWSIHGYQTSKCTESQESIKSTEIIKKNSKILNKYNYYYILFKNSEQTVKRIKELVPKLEQVTNEKFLFNAIQTHNNSRRVYQYLQIVLHYLKDSYEKKFLEYKIDIFYQKLNELSSTILELDPMKDFNITSSQRIQIITLDRQISGYQKELSTTIETMDELLSTLADEVCSKWGCTGCDTIYELDQKICTKCNVCQVHKETSCIECGNSSWSRNARRIANRM